MDNKSLKLLQVKQILGNAFFTDETRLRLLNCVVNNDFGKLTMFEARRLKSIRRGFSTSFDVKDSLCKSDRSLVRRGLAYFRVDRKMTRSMFADRKPYRNKTLVLSAVGNRALDAYEATFTIRGN